MEVGKIVLLGTRDLTESLDQTQKKFVVKSTTSVRLHMWKFWADENKSRDRPNQYETPAQVDFHLFWLVQGSNLSVTGFISRLMETEEANFEWMKFSYSAQNAATLGDLSNLSSFIGFQRTRTQLVPIDGAAKSPHTKRSAANSATNLNGGRWRRDRRMNAPPDPVGLKRI